MANSPVVIPFALTQLATAVPINALTSAAQTVFTAPNGEKNVPMFIVFRDVSAAVNAGTTVSVGNTASATAYYNASTVLQNMLTTTGPIFLPLYGSTVGSATAYMPQLSNFTITFGGTLTSNGTIKVDVLGYVTAF